MGFTITYFLSFQIFAIDSQNRFDDWQLFTDRRTERSRCTWDLFAGWKAFVNRVVSFGWPATQCNFIFAVGNDFNSPVSIMNVFL